MLTSALITLCQQDAPDWSRVRIYTFLDEIQKMIFTQNATEQMRMYDSTTGLDPTFTAVSGTYEYNMTTANGLPYNAWRVCEVYTSDINDPVEDILTIDATPATAYARVIFPESVSGKYYVRCYRFPTTISAESVQLEVPSAYHLSHVYEGLMGLVEKFRSGKSERWEMFQQRLLPQLVKKLSEGKRRTTGVPYRSCGE